MRKRLISVLFTALISSSVAWADTELFTCSETGTGVTYLKVCVSDTGNITLFKSPWAQEHIRVAPALEGFMVCRFDPNRIGSAYTAYYYDAGDYLGERPGRTNGWDDAYRIEQPNGAKKFPVTIYRRTQDGLLELKQEFSVDTVEREVTIVMTLYNLSDRTLQNVSLVRLVDINVDNTGSDDGIYDDGFFTVKRSVTQYDGGPPNGGRRDAVSLSALTPNYPISFEGLGAGR